MLTDYRLNPGLASACKLDIPKFCTAEVEQGDADHMLEGKVINCLKVKFVARVRSLGNIRYPRATLKKNVLPVQRVAKIVASWAAANFSFSLFFEGEKR